MKFLSLKAGAFGCLKDWESPPLEGNMVVVYGNNESGKSTLFKLAATILYGFSPVSANPYIPWDGAFASCEAQLMDKEGREFSVYRRIRSRAEGVLTIDNKGINLGNNPIKQLEFLPSHIYNEVYALTVDELRFPEDEVWNGLEDRLIGGRYVSFLQPVSTVTDKITSEAGSLWRPDRQGKPRFKQLSESLNALKVRLGEAEENEKSMHNIEEDLEKLNTRLNGMIKQKGSLVFYLDRFERLYPIYSKLKAIKDWETRAGDPALIDGIPEEPYNVLREMEEQKNTLDREYKDLLFQRKNALDRVAVFNEFHEAVLKHRKEIREIIKSYSQIESDCKGSRSLQLEIERCKSRIFDRASIILQGGWKSEAAGILEKIDEAELRAAIESFRNIDAKYHLQEARAAGLKARLEGNNPARVTPVISLVMLLSGIIGLFFMEGQLERFVSSVLTASGICMLLLWLFTRKNSSAAGELRIAEEELNKTGSLRERAALEVKSAMKGLPIALHRLEAPDESLLVDVNTLKDMLHTFEDVSYKKILTDNRIKEKGNTIRSLMDIFSLPYRESILDNIMVLEECMTEADSRFQDSVEAGGKLEDVEKRIETIYDRIGEMEKQKEKILKSLDRLDGANLEEKIKDFKERKRCLERAAAFREELERSHTDMEALTEEIERITEKEGAWVFDTEEIARVKAEREQLDISLNELNEEMGSLKKELYTRQKNERLDDLKGQMESIKDERLKISQKRDRLILLKSILVEADRLFREENQPDVLLRGGNYLKIITGGRYDCLFTAEDGSRGLKVKGSSPDFPIDVGPPLSRGTQEQIYLALRLALIDHLDSDNEGLPIFLDEALVNWDMVRLTSGLSLLEDISKRRQVFLFTCHRWLADMLNNEYNAQIIELV